MILGILRMSSGAHAARQARGASTSSGARDDATYSHYALLRSIETLFKLPLLGHAGDPPPRPTPH
jgi:hypothetical protein